LPFWQQEAEEHPDHPLTELKNSQTDFFLSGSTHNNKQRLICAALQSTHNGLRL